MKKIKLEMEENVGGIDFSITNFNDLDFQTIKRLEDFSLKRNGYFRYDLKKFGIKKN